MKYYLKDGFELKNIAGDCVLVPRGAHSVDFSAVIVFNEAGVFLYNEMKNNPTVTKELLAQRLIEKYSIDSETAENDAAAFVDKMVSNDIAASAEE